MTKQNRSLAALWLFLTLLTGQAAQAVLETPQTPAPEPPMTVTATIDGRWPPEVYGWQLKVDPEGKAELVVRKARTPIQRQFTVPPAELAALRAAVEREKFFQLQEEYGQHVPDGSCSTLTISEGEKTNTVRMRFLGNWVRTNPEKLQEPARALRVLNMIRGWFDEPGAVDLRRYDKLVIDAAEKGGKSDPTK